MEQNILQRKQLSHTHRHITSFLTVSTYKSCLEVLLQRTTCQGQLHGTEHVCDQTKLCTRQKGI